jgi:hypothetical protein
MQKYKENVDIVRKQQNIIHTICKQQQRTGSGGETLGFYVGISFRNSQVSLPGYKENLLGVVAFVSVFDILWSCSCSEWISN